MECGKKVEDLAKQVEAVMAQQAGQLREVERMRDGVRRKAEEREKELAAAHRKELEQAEQRWRGEVNRWEREATSAKADSEREMEILRKSQSAELEALRMTLQAEQESAIANEQQCWEERLKTVLEDLRGREGDMTQRVSGLTTELRAAEEKLAVSQQRIVELEEEGTEGRSEAASLKARLKEEEMERDQLRSEVEALQVTVRGAKEEEKNWRERLTKEEGKLHFSI